MGIFAGLFLSLLLTPSLFASALVFKTTKKVVSDGKTGAEIATFDAAKYKKIRIGVFQTDWDGFNGSLIQIHAVEDKELILMDGFDIFPGKILVYDCPPQLVRISAKTSGNYKVFIWGEQ